MEIKVLDQFPQLVLNKESVFKIMDCHEESTVYGEVAREYERLEPWLYEKVHPKAVIAWEPQSSSLLERLRLPEGKAEPGIYMEPKSRGFLYLVMTLGKEPENYSSKLFEDGEYLSGMLLGAMADEYLFSFEDQVMPEVKAFCAVPGFGVLRRMEAPMDIPLEFHQYVYERCDLKALLGMELSSGYMFDPVKTSCLVFLLSDETSIFNAWHDCSHCPAVGCRRRKA